jgi:hypothetical protein
MRKLSKDEKTKIKEYAEAVGGAVLFAVWFYALLILAYVCE